MEGLLTGESLLSLLSAFAPTKRLGEEEVTARGLLKACFTAGRSAPAVLEAARRREERSIGVFFFLVLFLSRVNGE